MFSRVDYLMKFSKKKKKNFYKDVSFVSFCGNRHGEVLLKCTQTDRVRSMSLELL